MEKKGEILKLTYGDGSVVCWNPEYAGLEHDPHGDPRYQRVVLGVRHCRDAAIRRFGDVAYLVLSTLAPQGDLQNPFAVDESRPRSWWKEALTEADEPAAEKDGQ